MPNAISYIKNVGKSVAYTSVNVLKDMNPVINDFHETNGETMAGIYKTVRKIKLNSKSIRSAQNKVMESKYGKFGQTYLNNLMSDLKTGKFYNKERIERDENAAAMNMMGLDGEDFNFDSGDSDDFNFDDSFGGEPTTNEMIDIVGEKTSSAISNAMARSAEYIVQGTTDSNKAIYNQINAVYGGLHAGMSTINQNISKLVEFSGQTLTTHLENSKTFYEEITRLDQERNQYLKEIADGVKQLNAPAPTTKTKYKEGTYSDIVNYNGVVDLSAYYKNIKKNLSNKTGGMGDLINMMFEMGAMDTLASSPISSIMETAMKAMLPNMLKESMEAFNKSLSGVFGNIIMGLSNKADKDDGILGHIAEILGINTSLTTKLNPGNYEKGKVPFDGITRKAIIEVIPTYLSKILAAINGESESRFNYESGKFVSVDELKKEFYGLTKEHSKRAASDLNYQVNHMKDKMQWDNPYLKRQFEEDWEAIMEYMYKNQKVFNTSDKNINASTFGLKGGAASELSIKILREMLDGNPEMLRLADQIYKERDYQNRKMVNYENDGTMSSIVNGSVKESKTPSAAGTSFAAAANADAVSELVAIHKELSFIRIYGTGGGGRGRKGKYQAAGAFDNFEIPKAKVQTPSNMTNVGEQKWEWKFSDEGDSKKYKELQRKYDILDRKISRGEANKNEKREFEQIKSSMDRLTSRATKEAVQIKEYDEKFKDATNRELEAQDLNKKASDMVANAKKSATEALTERKSFSQRMNEAVGLTGKMSVLINSATELAKKPAKFIVSMMDKADERMYDLIYGSKDDTEGKKSFIGRLFKGLEGVFNKFSDFLQEKILDPLKERFSKENIDKFLEKIGVKKYIDKLKTNILGEKDENGRYKNGKLSGVVNQFKDSMSGAKNWVKGAFKDVGDWAGVTSELNEQGKAKKEANEEASALEKALNLTKVDDIPTAATGMRRARKTGLAIVSEGEAIIPPDMNPFNVSTRKRNEKKVKDDLKKGIDLIGQYAEGTDSVSLAGNYIKSKEEKESWKREQAKKLVINKLRPRYDALSKKIENGTATEQEKAEFEKTKDDLQRAGVVLKDIITEGNYHRQEFTSDDYSRKNIVGQSLDQAGEWISSAGSKAVGYVEKVLGMTDKPEEEQKKLKENINTFIGEGKKYGGAMGAGAVIGTGVSVLTGAIGGPLVGAAVGAATGLITKSETVQKMLFGDFDENGERTGGLISKNISQNINKYFPNMAKGATVGGILTALPIVPGGPIAGIVLGSAVGFATKNNRIQEYLFGTDEEGGKLGTKKQFQDKVRRVLPKMGAGALIGLLAGPFSLVPNLILGSALGFASDTNKFKDFMFGKEENGKRTGGLVKKITDPLTKFFQNDIIGPLKEAFGPLKQQVKVIGRTIHDAISNSFKKHVTAPLGKFLKEKIMSPLGKFFGKIFGTLLKPVKGLLSLPFKAVRGIGNGLRKRQLRKGNADDINSTQRLLAARQLGLDNYKDMELDKSMQDADLSQLQGARDVVESISTMHTDPNKLIGSANKNISKYLKDSSVSHDVSKKLSGLINAGEYERAIDYAKKAKIVKKDANGNDVDDAETRKTLLETLTREQSKLKTAKEIKEKGNVDEVLNNAVGALQGFGINISKKELKSMSKGDKQAQTILRYLNKEIEDRKNTEMSPEEEATTKLNDDTQKRYEELKVKYFDPFKQALDKIAGFTTDENGKRVLNDTAEKSRQAKESRFNAVAGLGGDLNAAEPEAQTRGEHLQQLFGEGKVGEGVGLVAKTTKDAAFTFAKEAVNAIFKVIGMGFKGVGAVGNEVAGLASHARNSELGNSIFGDKSIDYMHPDQRKEVNVKESKIINAINGFRGGNDKVAVVSEGETIVSDKDDIDNAPEFAKGGVFEVFNRIKTNTTKIAGVLTAMGLKNGVDTSKITDNGDAKSFFGKISTNFKQKSSFTQIVDGRPLKFIKDKNGDDILDASNAENKETMAAIQEKESTQKGILAGITGLGASVGGFFSKFINGDDDEEGLFSMLFGGIGKKVKGFFSGIVNTVKGIYKFGKKLLPILSLILLYLGFKGKLDNVAAKLTNTNNAFDKKGTNDKYTIRDDDGNVHFLQTDESGNPITDESGNYVDSNGQTLSGDSKVEQNGSLSTMSLSDRLKYNTVRGTLTGKGSVAGYVLTHNKYTKKVANKVIGKAKNVANFGNTLTNTTKEGIEGSAALLEAGAQVDDKIASWTKALKKVPFIKKYADKIDDLGKAVASKIKDKLPQAGAKLAGIRKVFEKLNVIMLVASIVVDFTTGWQDASTILRIKKENVTTPQKIVCGLVRTVKNFIPIIGTFIPESLITDLLIDHVAAWFGIDTSEIKQQQAEAQEELDKYNEENNTDLSWAEYNKQVLGNYTWTEKIGNAAKGAGKKIKESFVDIKEKGVANTVIKMGTNQFDIIKNMFAKAWKGDIKGIFEIQNDLKDDDNALVSTLSKIQTLAARITCTVPALLVAGLGGIVRVVKPVIQGVVTLGTGQAKVVKDMLAKSWKGDIKGAFTTDAGVADSDNKLLNLLSHVTNFAVKIPMTGPTLIIGGLSKLVQAIKPVFGWIKFIGTSQSRVVKDMLSKAWKGDVKGAFGTDAGIADSDNKFISTVSHVTNFATKIPMAVPTLLTAGLGGIVRVVKPVIQGVVTLGTGQAKVVKDMMSKAWKGDIKGAFTSDAGITDSDNNLINTLSHITNFTVKIPMAVPTLLTAGLGGIVRTVKKVAGYVVTIGQSQASTAKDMMSKAWKGDIKGAFTSDAGVLNTDNDFINKLSSITNFTAKIPMAIPAVVTAGIGAVVNKVKDVVEGIKGISSNIMKTSAELMARADSGQYSIKEVFDISESNKTGNGLVDGLTTAGNTMVKIAMAPQIITHTVINVVKSKMTKMVDDLKLAGKVSRGDMEDIVMANNGDLDPLTSDYWKHRNSDSLTGIAKGINWFTAMVTKLLNLPAAIMANSFVGKIYGTVKGFFGKVNDFFVGGVKTGEELADGTADFDFRDGSGSGLRRYNGRGSDVPDPENGRFISQVDPRYRDKQFNISGDSKKQTIGDTGCAPAVAAMMVNSANKQQLSMEEASRNALRYKTVDDGVNASYFEDEFSRHGMRANYLTSNNRNSEILSQLSLNNGVVLMGQDIANNSKVSSPFGPNPHYVMATGISKDGKYIYINDPENTTSNVKYSTAKVLKHTSLGVSASGSRIRNINPKLSRYVARGSYGKNTIEYKVWVRLREAGYRAEQVAGIMGNIWQESKFDPSVIEKGNSGKGFGLCQWSDGRRTQIEEYASSVGKSANDLDTQLDFLLAEMGQNNSASAYAKYQFIDSAEAYRTQAKKPPQHWAIDSFDNATNVEDATKAFCYCWERPTVGSENIDGRIEHANEYYSEFVGMNVRSRRGTVHGGNGGKYSDSNSESTSDNSNKGLLSMVLDTFGGLADAYNLPSFNIFGDNSNSGTNSNVNSVRALRGIAPNNLSTDKEKAALQKQLVDKMYSIQNTIEYSQEGPRDPDQKSADCSSTVQWAYQNVLGVNPGDTTRSQRVSKTLYDVTDTTKNEAALQLGDLLLKDGHVEMYAGDGRMIGHGGGMGPKEKPLDQSGEYNLVRRWVGFKPESSGRVTKTGPETTARGSGLISRYIGKGSGVSNKTPYDNALKLISQDEFTSLLPEGYDTSKINGNKEAVITYNNNKLIKSKPSAKIVKPNKVKSNTNDAAPTKAVASGTNNNAEDQKISKYLQILVELITKMVSDTGKINDIFKLIANYMQASDSSDKSKESKQAAVLAKQNLINAIQGNSNSDKPSEDIMRLIQTVERIARE